MAARAEDLKVHPPRFLRIAQLKTALVGEFERLHARLKARSRGTLIVSSVITRTASARGPKAGISEDEEL
jgi:hypothetical protein